VVASLKDTGTRIRTPAPQPAPQAVLVVVAAPDAAMLGLRLLLRDEVVLGRDASCDLVLSLEDVSRRHARVVAEAGGHTVEDLGSTNGTFLGLGRERVTRRRLASGDLLGVGSAVLKYLAPGDPEAAYHDVLGRRAREDALTGLANRAAFDDALSRAYAASRRGGHPMSLLLLDIDYFKKVNDGHGHAAGDLVLRELAGLLLALVRREEVLARIGGEELAVVLPDAGLEATLALGERIRAAAEASAYAYEGASIRITLSGGAATLLPGDQDPEALLARADARLYDAKGAGRNCIRG
jgi:diguanylate cyclase (GGDEF)-like protein